MQKNVDYSQKMRFFENEKFNLLKLTGRFLKKLCYNCAMYVCKSYKQMIICEGAVGKLATPK